MRSFTLTNAQQPKGSQGEREAGRGETKETSVPSQDFSEEWELCRKRLNLPITKPKKLREDMWSHRRAVQYRPVGSGAAR